MALDIIQQPDADHLYMSRSPIIVTLEELSLPIVQDPTLRYSCRVRIWNGPIATPAGFETELLAFPNLQRYGVFNLSPLISGKYNPSLPTSSGTTNRAGQFTVQLDYGYYLNGSYTSYSSTRRFTVTAGYAIQQQQINAYFNQDLINDCEAFLTPRENTTVADGLDYTDSINVFKGVEQAREVLLVDDSGGFYTVDLSGAPTDTDDTIVNIPLSKAALATFTGGAVDPEKKMTVALTDGGSEIFQTINVDYISKDFCYVEDDVIAYVNRFGCWDYLYFRGRSSVSIGQKRETYLRRVTEHNTSTGVLQYPKGASQRGVISVEGEKRIKLSTGWLRQEQNEQVQDLLMSEYHYSFREGQNIVLSTENVDIIMDSNEELIRYDIEFRLAGNLIQKVL
jgi:hypothetical protein